MGDVGSKLSWHGDFYSTFCLPFIPIFQKEYIGSTNLIERSVFNCSLVYFSDEGRILYIFIEVAPFLLDGLVKI